MSCILETCTFLFFKSFYVSVSHFFVSPTHTGSKLVPGSRGNRFEVFSLNAAPGFLEKNNTKIICLHLKRISVQIIQWNQDFRFFNSSQVLYVGWKNPKSKLHWIFWAGTLLKYIFLKAFLVSSSTRVISETWLICPRSWWTKIFWIQWHIKPVPRWQNTQNMTFITNKWSWDFGF